VPRKRRGSAEVTFGNDEWIVVEDKQHGWHVWARFVFIDGTPRIAELRIDTDWGDFHAEHQGSPIPAGGVTTSVLRGVSTTALYDALGKDNASTFTLGLRQLDPDQDFLNTPRPGRRGRGDLFYALWAERYVAKCATTRTPYPELAAEHHYEVRTIRDFVQVARRRGLLVVGSQGRAGGRLTPKAKKLLEPSKGDTQ
jgi:hypothetical protein